MSKKFSFFLFLGVLVCIVPFFCFSARDIYSVRQKLVEARCVADEYRQKVIDAVNNNESLKVWALLEQNSNAVMPVLAEAGVLVPAYAPQLEKVFNAINEKFAYLYDESVALDAYQIKIVEEFTFLDACIVKSIEAVDQKITQMQTDVSFSGVDEGALAISSFPLEREPCASISSALISPHVLSEEVKKKLRTNIQKNAFAATTFLKEKELFSERSQGRDTDILRRAVVESSVRFWCACSHAPENLRIDLIIRTLEDVLQLRKSTVEPLIITSFASGTLGQEYLLARVLIDYGYKLIVINAIDKAYGRSDSLSLKRANMLKNLLTDYALSKGAFVTINTYDSIPGYLRERPENQKSYIVMMVDIGLQGAVLDSVRAEFLDLAKQEIAMPSSEKTLVYELNEARIMIWGLVNGQWQKNIIGQ